jgi:hypothetical protein
MRGILVGLFLAACGPPGRPGGDIDAGPGGDGPISFADASPTPDGVALAEICDNGFDDDLNGLIDDLCPCTLGDSQACFPGALAQRGVGACLDGTQACVGDPSGEFGEWGPCDGAITAATEVCEAGNLDEDCNGTPNDGCACIPGTTESCGSSTPPCTPGTRTCGPSGLWGDCLGGVGPSAEVCDGVNNDCDGETDEGCACTDGAIMSCGPSGGLCVPGTQTCTGGMWDACTGGVTPGTEICNNGIDENCNGNGDDACTPPVVTCSAAVTDTVLSTVTVSGTGSDPDGGIVTYRWTVTARPTGSTSMPASPNSASTNFFLDLVGSYTLTLTVTDDEGLTATCSVTLTATPNEELLVETVWSTAYGDVDVHLIRPGVTVGTSWYTGNDCFYANDPAMWPPMGPAGNADLDIDDTDGFGPENISVNVPQTGTYAVGVAFYCSHSLPKPGMPGTITPGDGPTVATVNVYCGSAVYTYSGIALDKTGRFVDLARITWPGCTGMSIDNRTWTALVQPAAYSQPLHCALPCTSNGDCGGGEVCGPGGTCVLD